MFDAQNIQNRPISKAHSQIPKIMVVGTQRYKGVPNFPVTLRKLVNPFNLQISSTKPGLVFLRRDLGKERRDRQLQLAKHRCLRVTTSDFDYPIRS